MIVSALILFAFQFVVALLAATLHLLILHTSTVATPASLGLFVGAMLFGSWQTQRKRDYLKSFSVKIKISLLNALLHALFGVFLFFSGALGSFDTMDMNMKMSIVLIGVVLAFLLDLAGLTLGKWNLRHYPPAGGA